VHVFEKIAIDFALAEHAPSSIIDRLESKGLLERRADPTDSRISRIHSTPVVKRFVAKRLPELSQGPLERAHDRASSAERAQIGKALRSLRELLDETRTELASEAAE